MPKEILKADSFIDRLRENNKNIGMFEVLSRGLEWFKHPRKLLIKSLQELVSSHKPDTIDFYLKKHNLD